VSNYIGVSGHCDFANAKENTGIFYGDSYIRSADITDGTSNTFMIGERDTDSCGSGTWLGVRNTNGSGTQGVSIVIGHSHPKMNQPGAANVANIGCSEGFSSLHPNGGQFLSCDGSVHFVSNTIEWFWYGTVAAGAAVDAEDERNLLYQRLMSRSDDLAISGLQ